MKAWRVGHRQRMSTAIRASARPGLRPLNTSVHASRLRAGAVVQHGAPGTQPDVDVNRREADGTACRGFLQSDEPGPTGDARHDQAVPPGRPSPSVEAP